jgi:hypothetical protein
MVSGATAPSKARWLYFQKREQTAWIPETTLALDERTAKRRLVSSGITLVGPAWKRALEMVDTLTDFPPVDLVEQPSWAGNSFALVDGTVVSPAHASDPPIAFETDPSKCRLGGSFEGWQTEVLRPLKNQSIPLSMLAFALAAPLLELSGRSENFGIELVGEPRCGKSICQFLMASMIGGTKNDSQGKYWITGDATLDGSESMMRLHSGMVMIINEANLFYADLSASARGTKLKALAFRLAQGHDKARFQGEKPASYRFIYVISSNAPLATLIPHQDSASAKAALDRLMTLRIDEKRPFKLFDFLPDGFDDSEVLANTLERAAQKHHGHAIRKFLQGLVEARAANPDRLVRRIRRLMAKFRSKAGLEGSGGYNSRIADAFALAYAAGELARRYGVFPEDIRCGQALAKTYALVANTRASELTLDERLRSLALLPGAVDLDCSEMTRMNDAEFQAVPVFFRTNRAGERETLAQRRYLDQAVPGWQKLLSEAGVKTVHARDTDRVTIKRKVRKGQIDRMVVLKVPPD